MSVNRKRSGHGWIGTWVVLTLAMACTAGAVAPPQIVPGTEGKTLPEPVTPDPSITLAILPDRTAGQDWGMPYLQQAVLDLNIIGPDAVFTVGDMVQGYTQRMGIYMREVEQYQKIVQRLEAPFYPVAGNHDVISGMRDSSDRQFETAYQEHFGPLYYAAFLDHVSVVAMYTDEQLESKPVISQEQIDWAGAQFEQAVERDTPLVVLMHKPAWRYKDSNWDSVHEKLAEVASTGQKVIVIAGHFHSMQRERDRDGVEYHLVGTCGGMIDQHPYTGQLQHFTLVKVTSGGETRVWHHPVGCTLPDDFVLRADQDRAHKLKSWRDQFVVETVMDSPVGQAVEETVKIKVSNPIDVPITVSAELLKARPSYAPAGGYSFFSRTPIDTFNPAVMRFDTPFEQTAPVEPIRLNPRESGYLEVPLRCESRRSMVRPPQINLTATFRDERGRSVPVWIPRRVPMRLKHEVKHGVERDQFITSWKFDVYDRFEKDPELGIGYEQDALIFEIKFFDREAVYTKIDDLKERIENPQGDNIYIHVGSGPEAHILMFEIFGGTQPCYYLKPPDEDDPESEWQSVTLMDVRWMTIEQEDGYATRIYLPLAVMGDPGEEVPLNVRITDNDRTYHTQWRSWAPPGVESTIVLPK